MSTTQRRGIALALILTVTSATRGADQTTVVKRAADLLEEISRNPESGIPRQELRDAVGIMILPHIVETELGLGRKRGHGIFLSRDEKGEWGPPEPVELKGFSLGAQAGRQVTDRVIIYRTRKAVEKYGESKGTLGLMAGLFASGGAHQRFHHPWLDTTSTKEVLAYEKFRSFMVGARLSTQRAWGPSFSAADPQAATGAGQKVAKGKAKSDVKTIVRHDASASGPGGKRLSSSPDMARLRTVLIEMTKPMPLQAATAGTKDPQVSQVSGERPPAPTASPRR